MATSVQFSIRSLLIAMVLTAVGLAAAMPVIRSWGTSTQLHFVASAGILAGFAGLFAVYRCALRRKTERLAGEVVLRAPTQGNRHARILYLCLLLLFIFGLFFQGASDAQAAKFPKPRNGLGHWVFLAYLGSITTWLVTNCWWGIGPGIVELAENGLIERGTRFTSYGRFRTFRWNRYSRGILILSSRSYQRTQIIVPRWEQDHIDRFLKEKGLISSQVACSSEANSSDDIET